MSAWATPVHLKVLVAGPFAAGKTTFIRSVADNGVVTTETVVSAAGALADGRRKDTTTVAMDFGRVLVHDADEPIDMMLFGFPGQERFRFMWHVLARGALGYVLLVDASDPASWADAVAIDATLEAAVGIPRVLAVNRWHEHHDGLRDLADLLGLAPSVPVLACDPRDRDSAVDVLLALLDQVLYAEQPVLAGPGPAA